MRMGQRVRTGLGHGGITCVLQTQFSSSSLYAPFCSLIVALKTWAVDYAAETFYI